MKVSCILTSFNRPRWIRDALRSIANQTHPKIELIVIDESDLFDIEQAVKEQDFEDVIVRHFKIDPAARRLENRLSVNCNLGLSLATGDLVTFLADDDYYYPAWFSQAVTYFQANPSVQVGFGKLVYSEDREAIYRDFPDPAKVRFYKEIVTKPANRLDHNQVVHRRFDPPFRWPTGVGSLAGPDAAYFQAIAERHEFHPIDAFACVKRLHRKSLLESQQTYIGGAMEGLRE